MGKMRLRLTSITTFVILVSLVHADTYSVKIGTEQHVNVVDTRFLSFTVDPEHLFSSSDKDHKKECMCMAASLTPAYIRIAGPSTSFTTFRNSTISIDALESLDDRTTVQETAMNEYQRVTRKSKHVTVTHDQWETFLQWAKTTGFDLVFGLNSEEKTATGMWDPNTALNILTVADKANVGDIFWQLGYECNNQSIEEYLNDLETLRVIIETFPPGRAGQWHVVGGDVTPCLQADSKSDFKDYVTLSNDMFDAVFLNGNSSSQELERMSEKDRLKLLKTLSKSNTPLWLTELPRISNELERAADWMTSLGYSARNGFAVHFRELLETEIYEPTLSFYMALLFKNLVGERVLSVDIEASQATMFAHCTSLRRKPIPGAVTLYGANMDDEPARFSIKLSKKEDGGDIMQFILGHDHNGNIVVNGRAMYYEGDIKPIVKRVRPYKTLLLNLPARSFGFWVLANTQVDACYDFDDNPQKESQFVEAMPVEASGEDVFTSIMKSKRSVRYDVGDTKESAVDFVELINETDLDPDVLISKGLKERMDNLNKDLQQFFPNKESNGNDNAMKSIKVKREAFDENIENEKRKPKKGLRLRNHKHKNSRHDYYGTNVISKLLQGTKRNRTNRFRKNLIKKKPRYGSNRHNEKYYTNKDTLLKRERALESKEINRDRRKSEIKPVAEVKVDADCNSLRKRRSIDGATGANKGNNKGTDENKVRKFRSTKKNYVDNSEDTTSENEIDSDKDVIPVGKIWHKLKKFTHLPIEIHEQDVTEDDNDSVSDMDEIVLKTKLLDDSAIINISENSKHGFIKSTIQDVLSVLADLNRNLNKIWSALTIFES